MGQNIEIGKLYYTSTGYVVVVEDKYMGQDKYERVAFKYLMLPEPIYDCYLDKAQSDWIPMESWHEAKFKWELK